MLPGNGCRAEVTRVDIPVRGGRRPSRSKSGRRAHGPVFADVGLDWEAPPAWLSPDAANAAEERRAYALRWDIERRHWPRRSKRSIAPTDWPSVLAAVERFSVPSQNFVYADVDGNIGYAMAGRVPVRDRAATARCRVNGTTGEGEWSGAIDAADAAARLQPAVRLHHVFEQRNRSADGPV